MYETLFKNRDVLARYRGGSYAEARERFVEDCAKQGYTHRTLVKIAWILMAVAFGLDLGNGKVTRKDVEYAVGSRRHFSRRPEGAGALPRSGSLFAPPACRTPRQDTDATAHKASSRGTWE